MTVKFNTKTSNTTRYILANEVSSSQIIHLYIGTDNNLHVGVRKNAGTWVTALTSKTTYDHTTEDLTGKPSTVNYGYTDTQ